MKYAVKLVPVVMIYCIPNYIKIDSGIQKLIGGDTQTHKTHSQLGVLKRLFLFIFFSKQRQWDKNDSVGITTVVLFATRYRDRPPRYHIQEGPGDHSLSCPVETRDSFQGASSGWNMKHISGARNLASTLLVRHLHELVLTYRGNCISLPVAAQSV
jgi:hypothetical protein